FRTAGTGPAIVRVRPENRDGLGNREVFEVRAVLHLDGAAGRGQRKSGANGAEGVVADRGRLIAAHGRVGVRDDGAVDVAGPVVVHVRRRGAVVNVDGERGLDEPAVLVRDTHFYRLVGRRIIGGTEGVGHRDRCAL